MKASLFFLSLSLLLSSGIFAQNGTISMHIEGGANKEVMIAYYLGDKQYIFGEEGDNHTVTLDANGEGEFTWDDMVPGAFLLVFPPENNYIEFFYEGTHMDLYANTEGVLDHPKNTVSNRLRAQMTEFQKQRMALEKNGKTRESTEFQQLSTAYNTFISESNAAHPNNMFLQMVKASEEIEIPENLSGDDRYYYFYEHYFDNIDFTQPWLLRSPVVYGKMQQYIEKYTVKHPDSIAAACSLLRAERARTKARWADSIALAKSPA